MCVPRYARYVSLGPSCGLRRTVAGKDVKKEYGMGQARESLGSLRGSLCVKNRDCISFALLMNSQLFWIFGCVSRA